MEGIASLETVSQVLDFVDDHLERFSGIHALLCFLRLGKRSNSLTSAQARRPGFSALLASLQRRAQGGSFDAEDLSNILLNAVYLRGKHEAVERLLRGCVPALLPALRGAAPKHLANSAWALAKLSQHDSATLRGIAQQAAAKLRSFKPLDVSRTAWAFATLGVNDFHVACLLPQQAFLEYETFSPQGVSMLAWSYAKLSIDDHHCFRMLHKRAMGLVENFKSQELSNLLWAFATVGFAGASEAFVSQVKLKAHELLPQGISNIAWSCATLGIEDPVLFRTLTEVATAEMADFKPQEASNLIWSLAKVRAQHEALFRETANVIATNLRQFTPHHLSQLLWAFATCSSSGARIHGALAAEFALKAKDSRPQGVSNVLWSMATLAISDIELFSAIVKTADAHLGDFNHQEVSNVIWALATVSYGDCPLVRAFAEQAPAKIHDLNLQDLSNHAFAFATLEQRDPELFSQIAGALSSRLAELHVESTKEATLLEAAVDALGVVWSFSNAGMTDPHQDGREDMLDSVGSFLAQVGTALDAGGCGQAYPLTRLHEPMERGAAHGQPFTVMDSPDVLVLHKPAGWACDTSEGDMAGGQRQLLHYAQAMFPSRRSPLLRDGRHRYGFLHRLDVPGAGLILAARTHRAYFHLQLQLAAGSLLRDYAVLCHGWMPPARRGVRSPVHAAPGARALPGGVRRQGRAARTLTKVLLHALAAQAAFSLLAIRIRTGRRHQIRVHTSYLGHPPACDGKYTGVSTFRSDREWCPQNFVYRYYLSFHDTSGVKREVSNSVPSSLQGALSSLRARDSASSAALESWLGGAGLAGWHVWRVLPWRGEGVGAQGS